MNRLLIVSNRLPLTVKGDREGVAIEPSEGGLATGLRGPHERSGGLWIGWPGDVSRLSPERRAQVEQRLGQLRAVPLYLSSSEVARYYEGFSNGVIWPLFHYVLHALPYDSRDWVAYERVNQRFADRVASLYQPGDQIWVHDYQLALVPAMLRSRLPQAQIGFFLHIPFPAAEVFRTLPWRKELLTGILGADLIGFHTHAYQRHFASSILMLLGVETHIDRVEYGGREIRLGTFPMGVDTAAWVGKSDSDASRVEPTALRRQAGGEKIILAVDRLDYTKGIPSRLVAMERLLKNEPWLRRKVRLIQVAVPSRAHVQAYAEFRRTVDETVGRINGKYGTVDWVPIHYLYQSISQGQLVELYRAADVMMVTPLRDGMNLVAKEFIAARTDEDGVLILSELAGAASELGEALQVNPYDADRVAAAIHQALQMSKEERVARMRAMRQRVLDYDVHSWAADFLNTLGRSSRAGLAAGCTSSPADLAVLVAVARGANRLLVFLDYDGTLVPFSHRPDLAEPDPGLIRLLDKLSRRSRTQVHVVSGRSRDSLARWLETLPLGLHAEYGAWSRDTPRGPWVLQEGLPAGWREPVKTLLEELVLRIPGTFLEEKSASMAWHYRQADAEFGSQQANELRVHLTQVLANQPVEVLEVEKAIEVRAQGANKGAVARRLTQGTDATVLAIGDDSTDEEMFAAVAPGSLTVRVGSGPSKARFRVSDSQTVRVLLRSLIDEDVGNARTHPFLASASGRPGLA
jgi:trehalose 6-phosphate synthase/phosphatase